MLAFRPGRNESPVRLVAEGETDSRQAPLQVCANNSALGKCDKFVGGLEWARRGVEVGACVADCDTIQNPGSVLNWGARVQGRAGTCSLTVKLSRFSSDISVMWCVSTDTIGRVSPCGHSTGVRGRGKVGDEIDARGLGLQLCGLAPAPDTLVPPPNGMRTTLWTAANRTCATRQQRAMHPAATAKKGRVRLR